MIDTDLDSKCELDALVADYLAEAQRLQTIPAAAIPFGFALADLRDLAELAGLNLVHETPNVLM
jgi:hypothetical protein